MMVWWQHHIRWRHYPMSAWTQTHLSHNIVLYFLSYLHSLEHTENISQKTQTRSYFKGGKIIFHIFCTCATIYPGDFKAQNRVASPSVQALDSHLHWPAGCSRPRWWLPGRGRTGCYRTPSVWLGHAHEAGHGHSHSLLSLAYQGNLRSIQDNAMLNPDRSQ